MKAKRENLSGEQIAKILDTFLYKALEPIVERTNVFDNQLIYVLSLITRNRKRKISSIPRTEAISLLCSALCEKNPAIKMENIRKVRLERSFVRNFVLRVLEFLRDFSAIYRQYLTSGCEQVKLRLSVMCRELGAASIDDLAFINDNCTDFLHIMTTYRNSVVNEYSRLMYKQASIYCNASNHNYDFHDVSQNFLSAVVRAIDKYDSNKGALTSYIKWWLLNSQTCNTDQHEYGISYSLPSQQKKDIALKKVTNVNNFAVSLNKITENEDASYSLMDFISNGDSIVDSILHEEKLTNVQKLVKLADPTGVVRLYLDIDEHFFPHELDAMRAQMAREKSNQNVNSIHAASRRSVATSEK